MLKAELRYRYQIGPCVLISANGMVRPRNNTLTQIKGIGSTHRMLASIPASILNQNPGDLGIPNRFRPKRSCSRSQKPPASIRTVRLRSRRRDHEAML